MKKPRRRGCRGNARRRLGWGGWSGDVCESGGEGEEGRRKKTSYAYFEELLSEASNQTVLPATQGDHGDVCRGSDKTSDGYVEEVMSQASNQGPRPSPMDEAGDGQTREEVGHCAGITEEGLPPIVPAGMACKRDCAEEDKKRAPRLFSMLGVHGGNINNSKADSDDQDTTKAATTEASSLSSRPGRSNPSSQDDMLMHDSRAERGAQQQNTTGEGSGSDGGNLPPEGFRGFGGGGSTGWGRGKTKATTSGVDIVIPAKQPGGVGSSCSTPGSGVPHQGDCRSPSPMADAVGGDGNAPFWSTLATATAASVDACEGRSWPTAATGSTPVAAVVDEPAAAAAGSDAGISSSTQQRCSPLGYDHDSNDQVPTTTAPSLHLSPGRGGGWAARPLDNNQAMMTPTWSDGMSTVQRQCGHVGDRIVPGTTKAQGWTKDVVGVEGGDGMVENGYGEDDIMVLRGRVGKTQMVDDDGQEGGVLDDECFSDDDLL